MSEEWIGKVGNLLYLRAPIFQNSARKSGAVITSICKVDITILDHSEKRQRNGVDVGVCESQVSDE